MTNFLQKFKFDSLKKTIASIFNRFFLSAIISFSAFSIMVSLLAFGDSFSKTAEEVLLKIFVTLVVSFFFSVAVYLYCESKNLAKSKKLIWQSAILLFAFLFYFFLKLNLGRDFNAETIVYVILTMLGVSTFLFVASYFQKLVVKIESQDEFYVATYRLLIKAGMSAIVGIATMLLGFVAILATFSLFDLGHSYQDECYLYWLYFALILFAPFFFLANVPKKDDSKMYQISTVVEEKFFAFLINYIGLPAIYIYFIILYAYTAKVLLNFKEWPHGEVAWMVISFSFLGYLIYFATYAFTEKFKHAKFFRQIFPVAVILQTPMLFYAIGLRIDQYGFTINRYLVVAFGLWLFCLSAYYLFSHKKDLSKSFYSLLIMTILISVGHWSVYSFPAYSQQKRLISNLEKANILQNGKIIPLNSYRDIDAELGGDIYNGIEYLCNFHGCDNLNRVFSKEIEMLKVKDKEDFEKNKKENIEKLQLEKADTDRIERAEDSKYFEMTDREVAIAFRDYLKVRRYDDYNKTANRGDLDYLRFENVKQNEFNDGSVKIFGYDYYLELRTSKNRIQNDYEAVVNMKDLKLVLYFGNKVLEEIDIQKSIVEKILNSKEKYIRPESDDSNIDALLSESDLTFDLAGNVYDLRVVLRSIDIKNPDWSEEQLSKETKDLRAKIDYSWKGNVSGYVLIREKKLIKK